MKWVGSAKVGERATRLAAENNDVHSKITYTELKMLHLYGFICKLKIAPPWAKDILNLMHSPLQESFFDEIVFIAHAVGFLTLGPWKWLPWVWPHQVDKFQWGWYPVHPGYERSPLAVPKTGLLSHWKQLNVCPISPTLFEPVDKSKLTSLIQEKYFSESITKQSRNKYSPILGYPHMSLLQVLTYWESDKHKEL